MSNPAITSPQFSCARCRESWIVASLTDSAANLALGAWLCGACAPATPAGPAGEVVAPHAARETSPAIFTSPTAAAMTLLLALPVALFAALWVGAVAR